MEVSVGESVVNVQVSSLENENQIKDFFEENDVDELESDIQQQVFDELLEYNLLYLESKTKQVSNGKSLS